MCINNISFNSSEPLITLGSVSPINGPLETVEENFISGIRKIIAGLSNINYSQAFPATYASSSLQTIKSLVKSTKDFISSYYSSDKGTEVTHSKKNNIKRHNKGISKVFSRMGKVTLAFYLSTKFCHASASLNSLENPIQPITFLDNAPNLDTFFHNHENEIKKVYEDPLQIDPNWEILGQGASKLILAHPNLSHYVVKVEKDHNDPNKNSIEKHHENSKKIKGSLDKFPKIVIPNSSLYYTKESKAPVLFEQIIHPIHFEKIPDSPEKELAINSLKKLLKKFGICDVRVAYNHNAVFIKTADGEFKIALIDADCTYDSDVKKFSELNLTVPSNLIDELEDISDMMEDLIHELGDIPAELFEEFFGN